MNPLNYFATVFTSSHPSKVSNKCTLHLPRRCCRYTAQHRKEALTSLQLTARTLNNPQLAPTAGTRALNNF